MTGRPAKLIKPQTGDLSGQAKRHQEGNGKAAGTAAHKGPGCCSGSWPLQGQRVLYEVRQHQNPLAKNSEVMTLKRTARNKAQATKIQQLFPGSTEVTGANHHTEETEDGHMWSETADQDRERLELGSGWDCL